MSATNTTTTYQLPIFVGSDVPSWLTDWNGAMTDIDTAIAAAKTTADGAALTAGNASSGVATNANAITALQTTVGNHTTAISNNAGSINTINSLIGNGVPTTTDQTIIGAINEINAAYKDAANINFDNTGTSMSATTVQAAIVEAFNNGGGTSGSVLLWTNSELNSGSNLTAFAGQTLSLDLTNYDAVRIEYCDYTRIGLSSALIPKLSGYTAYLSIIKTASDADYHVVIQVRNLTISNTGIVFEDGKQGNLASGDETQNLRCIPLRIYGVKY